MKKWRKNTLYLDKEWTVDKVQKEVDEGLALLESIEQPMVTFFGGHLARGDRGIGAREITASTLPS